MEVFLPYLTFLKKAIQVYFIIFDYVIARDCISLQNRLRGSGHGVAAARMDAKLNVAGWVSEQMGGVRLGIHNISTLFSSL